MSEEEKEGFLSRWSRRKRAAEEEAPETPPVVAEGEAITAPPDEAEAAPVARASCPIPDVPEIDPATLPPIESLTAESDFGQFLRPGVPTLLRNAALRRMWSLDPAIRDYIGPVDYQWDFNTPGGLPFGFSNELVGDVQKLLAQAIGKIEELAEDKPAEEGPDSPAAEAGPDGDAPAGDGPAPDAPPALVAEAVPVPQLLAEEAPPPRDAAPEPAVQPPRRRHGGALPA